MNLEFNSHIIHNISRDFFIPFTILTVMSSMSLLELKQELNDITMGEDKEPSALFGRRMWIKNCYDALLGDEMSDQDLMTATLRAGPEKYQTVLTSL